MPPIRQVLYDAGAHLVIDALAELSTELATNDRAAFAGSHL